MSAAYAAAAAATPCSSASDRMPFSTISLADVTLAGERIEGLDFSVSGLRWLVDASKG